MDDRIDEEKTDRDGSDRMERIDCTSRWNAARCNDDVLAEQQKDCGA
jgi:hypothetical protein